MTARSGLTKRHWLRLATHCVVLALVLSLALVTSARRAAMAASAETEASYAQFLASGGSFEDLCRDSDLPHPGSAACDACRLTDLALVPVVMADPVPFSLKALPDARVVVTGLTGPVFSNPAAPARGPPMIA